MSGLDERWESRQLDGLQVETKEEVRCASGAFF
jgi:hypothetical protein